LGLAVARRLARLMEGSLTYERTGTISVFELTLPLRSSIA
jgi:signal transduction histidine kinase